MWIKKIKIVSSDLSKQSNALDNDVIKKTLYNKLVIKVTVFSTKILNKSRLLTKTKYDSDEEGLEKKITDVDKKIPKVLRKKRLITTRLVTTLKPQRLQTRYLALLV